MKIRMIGNMAMMQYASKFTELLRFILDFIATETIKRFKEGLAFTSRISWLNKQFKLIKSYTNKLLRWNV